MSQLTEVSVPTSPQEARRLFAADRSLLVAGGATIVTPELATGARGASHVMLLHRAGMDEVVRNGQVISVGAAARLSALGDLPEPLRGAIAGVADPEVRAQATLGGNLCAAPLDGAPRGDLQGPLIALDAQVDWTDGVADHQTGIEEFLALDAAPPRLVLGVRFALPRRGAHATLRRPHSHSYTSLAVSAAQVGDELRLAATGLSERAVRLGPPEQPLAADAIVRDDALASAWYRAEMIPVLVRRCLVALGEPA